MGSQTDPLTPWHDERAEIITFQYLPPLLGGKGIPHVRWDTGDLPYQGKKLRAFAGIEPHPSQVAPTCEVVCSG